MRVVPPSLTRALACLLLVTAPLAAAAAAKPATPAELVRQVSIPFSRFTLPNGLRVVVHEDHKAPVVAIAAWYNVGSKDEPAGRTGFAHLFEHIGLFNGTENLPDGLMAPLQALGATDWNGTTWYDRTNFFQTVPTAAVERALYMESDRMGHLLGALTQERLDAQRGVVQNEKRQGDNEPYGLVGYVSADAMFPPGHPYRHNTIGSMEDLDAASLEDVRQWHRDHYGPNNAVLVLAGDLDLATARRLVTHYFGDIPRGKVNSPAKAAAPTLPARIDAVMHDHVQATRLYRSWIVPGVTDRSVADLDVAAAVLGGLASSRLANELVRGDESASAVTAHLQVFQRIGMFDVTVDVKTGRDVDAVSKRLDRIIGDFIAKGPTADEVNRVVTSELSTTIQALETTGGFTGKAVVLAEGELYANDPGFYRKQMADTARVTPASATAAMRRWLTRPVYALRVQPGDREPYAEAASTRLKPAPLQALPIAPREPLPAIAAMKPLTFPAVERSTLSNGLPIVYLRSTTVPTTRIALEFDAGAAADASDAIGAQRLMLDALREGAGGLDAPAIAQTEERLGAEITTTETMDRSTVSLTALTANLAPSLDLFTTIVTQPTFAPGDVDRRRAQQLAAIAQEQDAARSRAARTLWPLVFGVDHPYGRVATGLGSASVVTTLTPDALKALHRRWIRPDNATLFVISDRPLAEVRALLDARLGSWTPAADARGVKMFPGQVPKRPSRIVLLDRPQSPQSVILAGEAMPLTGQGDQVALNVANEILAGGFLARINVDIRETRGWSYGVYGLPVWLADQSSYFVYAPVQADRTGDSIAVLMQQYKDFIGDKGVTQAERDLTVDGDVGRLPGRFETSSALMAALQSNALYRRPDDYWTTIAARYQALTPADLDTAARRGIDGSGLVWVVVGDAATVRPQLDKLGLEVEQLP